MKTSIVHINAIEVETAKAYKFNCSVNWGCGSVKQRSFWFPKSQVVKISETIAEVKIWFARKVEQENAFNGYEMNFDCL